MSIDTDQLPAYIARCPHCNAVIGLATARPEHSESTADILAEWARDALIIERVTAGEAKRMYDPCFCFEGWLSS